MHSLSCRSIFYIVLGLLVQSLCVLGQEPSVDPDAPLKYIPNKIFAAVDGSIYVATAIGFLIWCVWYKGYYMVTIIAGTVGYALGLFLRIRYAEDPTSAPTFNAMDLFLLLSPCGFIAGVIMILTCLATYLDAVDFLVIKPRLMTRGFLLHEFVVFLAQGTGSAMSISTNVDIKSFGARILIISLVLQTISLSAFTTIYAVFVFRLRKYRKEEWSNRPNGILKHWLALVMVLGVGLQNLSIRGGYRMLVAMQGPDGFLSSTEQYFYTAECITLWGAISSFLLVWPPKYLAMPRPMSKKHPEVVSVASFYSGPRG